MGRSPESARTPLRATSTLARLLVLAAFVALLVVSSAPASTPPPRWLAPLDVSVPGTDALVPVVAVDPRGDAIAVWAQSVDNHWVVMAAKRTASRPWSAPRALSVQTSDAASPQVATDGAGNAVAVWQWFDGKNSIVQAASFDIRKGRWSGPVNLSLGGRDSVAPRLAVNDRGDAVAVWTSLSFAGWTVEGTFRPAGGAWEKAAGIILPVAGTASPDVAVDPSGNVVVVWAATTGSAWVVQASYRPFGGSWSLAADLSQPDRTESITPQVAIQPSGEADVVWSRSSGGSPVIEQSARSSTGAWATARVISRAGSAAVAPLIAVGQQGDAAIVWTSSGKSGLAVTATYRRNGGDWGPAVKVSGSSSGPLSPSVAVDGRGDVVIAWTRAAAARSVVQTASRAAATGTWSTPVSLSQVGADALTPDVALAPSGDGALVWSRFSAQGFVVQAVGYDSSGPALPKVRVPEAGVVGGRLAFAVVPRDIWSGVASIRWTFGDGSAASGNAVAHVYNRPGRFAVRVTATDGFGHSSTTRRFVSIAAG